MQRYRKKPVVIEAIKWDGSYKSTQEVLEFMGQTVATDKAVLDAITSAVKGDYDALAVSNAVANKSDEIPTSKAKVTQYKFDDYVALCNDKGMHIETLEGYITATVGDYIIKGVQGEFYPCKPDIFNQSYEMVEVNKKITAREKSNTHYVVKIDDIAKYLDENQGNILKELILHILTRRIMAGRSNGYYICNTDEPYADNVLRVILEGESSKEEENAK